MVGLRSAASAVLALAGCGRAAYAPAEDGGAGDRALGDRVLDGAELDDREAAPSERDARPDGAKADATPDGGDGSGADSGFVPSAGALDWARRHGGSEENLALDVATDPDGNVLTVGYFHGVLEFGEGLSAAAESWDGFVDERGRLRRVRAQLHGRWGAALAPPIRCRR